MREAGVPDVDSLPQAEVLAQQDEREAILMYVQHGDRRERGVLVGDEGVPTYSKFSPQPRDFDLYASHVYPGYFSG